MALTRHAGDRRRLMVSLTAEGRAAIERLVPLARAITAETLAPLSAREAETLTRLLNKIA